MANIHKTIIAHKQANITIDIILDVYKNKHIILPVTKKLVQVYAEFVYTKDLKVSCKEAAAYAKMKISINNPLNTTGFNTIHLNYLHILWKKSKNSLKNRIINVRCMFSRC